MFFYTESIFEEKPFDFLGYRVNSWKSWINEIMAELERVKSNEIKSLTYFSVIDMLAQDYYNYPERGNQKTFTDFVLKFQNKCDYLDLTDPVTLYYHVQEKIKDKVSLEELEDGGVYYPQNDVMRNKVSEIRAALEPMEGAEFCNIKERQHRYVDLLYRMRCRISHELSISYMSCKQNETEPYYINCSRRYFTAGRIVTDDVWKLLIPVQFLRELCLNCFDNYLKYCVDEGILPGQNNGMDRICELSWHIK